MTTTHAKKVADGKLERTLKETFPASDAASSNEAEVEPTRPYHRKPAHIDPGLVEELAKDVDRKLRRKTGS